MLTDSLIEYERRVYSVFDLLGDVGGIEGSLSIVFGFIVSSYVSSAFQNSVINQQFDYIDTDKKVTT